MPSMAFRYGAATRYREELAQKVEDLAPSSQEDAIAQRRATISLSRNAGP